MKCHRIQIAKIETIFRDELCHILGILVPNSLACTLDISKEFGHSPIQSVQILRAMAGIMYN